MILRFPLSLCIRIGRSIHSATWPRIKCYIHVWTIFRLSAVSCYRWPALFPAEDTAHQDIKQLKLLNGIIPKTLQSYVNFSRSYGSLWLITWVQLSYTSCLSAKNLSLLLSKYLKQYTFNYNQKKFDSWNLILRKKVLQSPKIYLDFRIPHGRLLWKHAVWILAPWKLPLVYFFFSLKHWFILSPPQRWLLCSYKQLSTHSARFSPYFVS